MSLGRSGLPPLVVLVLVPVLAVEPAFAQCSGFPAGGILNGTINTYYPAPDTAANVTAVAGATCIRVDNAARQGSASTIAAGDLLLLIQVQGGSIDTGNDECYGDNTDEAGGAVCDNLTTSGDGSGTTARTAGTYEYVVATAAVVVGAANACGSGVTGDSVNIAGGGAGDGLIGNYTSARLVTGSTGQGQQTYQVVRVPQYQTAQVGNAAGTATVTASAWNGRSGGVVAFDVAGTLTVQTNSGANPPPAINASGFGFRGAVAVTAGGTSGTAFDRDYRRSSGTSVHANKGEGIAGTPSTLSGLTSGGSQGYPQGDRARGGPGNAGGGGSDGNVSANDENTGGGGGGNGGKGGRGGNAWRSADTTGGFGGAAYTATASQLIMGGGGGGGTNNNNSPKSAGATGGGMIFVRANNLTGTATFNANGNAAPNLEDSAGATNDSGGGGGAGGSIVVLSSSALPTTLSLNANGGFGANANAGASCSGSAHGPGAGGAGGVILTSDTNPVTRSVTGALPGLTNSVGSGGGAGTCDCLAPAANKVPAGNCIQYGATAGTTGQTLTTTLNGLPGVRTCVTASRATLAGLRVDASGGISFATASERDTLAFRLYESDAAGRGLLPLTPSPLPARGRLTVGPQTYRVETRPLERAFVVVEEIEASGHRRRLGPFAASDPVLEDGFVAAEESASRQDWMHRARVDIAPAVASVSAGVRGARAPVASLPGLRLAGAIGVKIMTRGRGPVEVALADLEAAGVAARPRSPSAIRLYNLGREVPFERLEDPDGRLVGLRFVALPLATDYTGDNVYVLTFGTRSLPPSVTLTRSGFPLEPGAVRIEQDAFYIPWLPLTADPWQWGVVFEDVAPSEFPFDLPGLVAGGEDVPVRVGLVGATDHEHVVAARLNGQPIGEVHFTGKAPAEIRALVPASSLAAAGNTLSLEYTSDDASAFALVDNLDLGVSAQVDGPASVVRVEAYDPRLPALRGAEYLILSPSDFAAAAERLARAKRSEGHRPRTVLVERAFDRYSGGVFEASAIAALIRDTRRLSPGLRYVLLLGDDTFDPRGHLGLGEVSRVPSIFGFDGQFGRVPSETAYADTDGDGAPDVAIGRLPAATVEEAFRLVEKVERQNDLLRPGKGRHVLAVDNEGPEDATFRAMADDVANGLPAGSTRVFADLSQGLSEARAILLQSMRDGAATVQYFGHGSNAFWADEHLLDTSSAQDLAGAGRASFALSWTCEADWYQYHLGPSLGETLLHLPDGGTVAAFGPSGITNPRAQGILYRRLYPLLQARVPVGEAVRRAKAAVAREEPLALPVLAGFNLLGDPALVVP